MIDNTKSPCGRNCSTLLAEKRDSGDDDGGDSGKHEQDDEGEQADRESDRSKCNKGYDSSGESTPVGSLMSRIRQHLTIHDAKDNERERDHAESDYLLSNKENNSLEANKNESPDRLSKFEVGQNAMIRKLNCPENSPISRGSDEETPKPPLNEELSGAVSCVPPPALVPGNVCADMAGFRPPMEEEVEQSKPEATFKLGYQSRKVIQQIREIDVSTVSDFSDVIVPSESNIEVTRCVCPQLSLMNH